MLQVERICGTTAAMYCMALFPSACACTDHPSATSLEDRAVDTFTDKAVRRPPVRCPRHSSRKAPKRAQDSPSTVCSFMRDVNNNLVALKVVRERLSCTAVLQLRRHPLIGTSWVVVATRGVCFGTPFCSPADCFYTAAAQLPRWLSLC